MIRLFAVLFCCLFATSRGAGLPPSAVESFHPGQNAGFGSVFFPGNALNGPDGGDSPPNIPSDVPENILTLGDRGSITLRWDGGAILNGPGPDFTVFENVLENAGDGVPFVEAGIVSVSQNGDDFTTFTFRFDPPAGWSASDPFAIDLFAENYVGLAGTRATLVTPENGIDPADPAVSGGDSFDLEELGLAWVRYVRITDPGFPGASDAVTGTNGLAIWDLGTTVGGGNNVGFDLDTVIAIHHGNPATSVQDWVLY